MGEIALILGKAGFILFTVGLALGAAIPRFHNPRMALSAHLTSVQAGISLIAFGLFWSYFNIPPWASNILALSLIASFSILIVSLLLAAIFGASKALPIAGSGFRSSKTKELVVSFMTIGSSIWMLTACLTICFFFLTA